MEIYEPLEDSYLLSETLKEYLSNINNKEILILDMGSGSGIQAETCRDLGFKNIVAADINQEAVKLLKQKRFNTVHSDLFSNIDKKQKFDLIIFNPPYLPEDKNEPADSRLATTAGREGYEVIIRFLKQSKDYLNKNGKILLLFSSFSKPAIIKKQAKELGYNLKQLSNKKLFYEELFVYELKQNYLNSLIRP